MNIKRLGRLLESIYQRYHSQRFLGMDPLQCVRPFAATPDAEIAGLVAAALAYGRVEQIVRAVQDVLDAMNGRPRHYAVDTSLLRKRRDLRAFRHRFTSGDDVAALLEATAWAVREYGSLDAYFGKCLALSSGSMRGAAERFAGSLAGRAHELAGRRMPGVDFLLPSPARGSACKRLNMYFRWMIRRDDGIDLGAWLCATPSILIIPLDAHVWRASQRLGLTSRRRPDWQSAEEITARLRQVDAHDPVRFDFALCREDMMKTRSGKHESQRGY